MQKTLIGLGLSLALLGAGCTPNDPAASPSPNATSANAEVLPRDVASVDLVDDVTVRDAIDLGEVAAADESSEDESFSENDLSMSEAKTGLEADRGPEIDLAQKLLKGHRGEQELAKLALSRGADRGVLEAARMIQKDHQLAEAKLREAVLIPLPSTIGLSPDHVKLKDRLDDLDGDRFDRAYIDAMVKEHEKDLKLYKERARSAPTEALRTYFAQHISMLEQHLKHCKSVKVSLG